MKQNINNRVMMLPQGTHVKVLGKLPDGSFRPVLVRLEHDMLVETDGVTYVVAPAWVDTAKWILGCAVTVALCFALW